MSVIHTSGRWKADNLRSICSDLRTGFKGGKRDWSYRKPYAKVVRRGRLLPNGDMLWMEGGRLYVEKAK
jgi:hypothetical protein